MFALKVFNAIRVIGLICATRGQIGFVRHRPEAFVRIHVGSWVRSQARNPKQFQRANAKRHSSTGLQIPVIRVIRAIRG